ncbi:MAG TPA: hypothetical protein VHC63_11665 [Acidimicrobiales bacterium]|nr:hypothetical protein [Acidimicrobiales bacterium]
MSDAGVCEKCGAAPAKPYSFWYGAKSGPDEYSRTPFRSGTSSGVRTTVTTHFRIGGTDTALLCHACVLRGRESTSVRKLLREFFAVPLIAFFYVMLTIGVVAMLWNTEFARAAGWFVAAVGLAAVVFAGIFAYNGDDDCGQHMTVAQHEATLRGQGWTEFWTAREYKKLRPSR